MTRRLPISTLFPYTTLFRSELILEDKGLTLALHYRRAPNLARLAHRVMHAVQHSLGDQYCVHRGKRSEEHRSELQSQSNLVCRLLLEKKISSSPRVTQRCAW